MEIEQLYIYPVKSILPLAVPSATISKQGGFKHDRQYVIVKTLDEDKFDILTIKKTAKVCLFQPTLSEDGSEITIRYKHDASSQVTLPLDYTPLSSAKRYPLELFSLSTEGVDMGQDPAAFFSKHLGFSVRLFFVAAPRDPHPALIPSVDDTAGLSGILSTLISFLPGTAPARRKHDMKINMQDVAPILMTTSASLDEVSSRLPEGIEMDVTKFRTNIHVRVPPGTEPYDEEFWTKLEFTPKDGEEKQETTETEKIVIHLDAVFNTARCQSLNVDYDMGEYAKGEKEVYKLLMKDRRINPHFTYKPCFGRYCFCDQYGMTLRVGDRLEVKGRNEERHVEVS